MGKSIVAAITAIAVSAVIIFYVVAEGKRLIAF